MTADTIVERTGNKRQFEDELSGVLDDPSDEEVGRLLWEAFRDGADLGKDARFGELLADAPPEAYEAEDLLEFIRAVAEHHPPPAGDEGTPTSGDVWAAGSVPGRLPSVGTMIEKRLDDEQFVGELTNRAGELPAPWERGLQFDLAVHGLLEAEALSDELLAELAERHVRYGKGDKLELSRKQPWPEQVWRQGLVEAAGQPGVTFEHAGVLADLVERADAEQMVEFAGRVEYSPDLWEGIEALEEVGEPLVEPLEGAIADLDVGEPTDEAPWPPVVLIPAYLRLCRKLDREPDEDLDPTIAEFVEVYDTPWGGRIEKRHRANLREALSVLPDERLESMVMAADPPKFSLIDGNPNRLIARYRVRSLENMRDLFHFRVPRPTAERRRELKSDLAGVGEALYPPLKEAFEEHRIQSREDLLDKLKPSLDEPALSPEEREERERECGELEERTRNPRVLVLEILGEIGEPAAAPVFAEALTYAEPDVRKAARRGLENLPYSPRSLEKVARGELEGAPSEVVAEALADPLAHDRDETRRAAAEILADLPPGERAYDLAQRRLEEEDSSEIRDILESIDLPGTGGAGLDMETLDQMLDPDDEPSPEFGPGARMIEAYGRKLPHPDAERHSQLTEMVEALDGSFEAVTAAVGAVQFFDQTKARKRLVELHEKFGRVDEALIEYFDRGFQGRFGPRQALEWLLEHSPEAGADQCLALLEDDDEMLQRVAADLVPRAGEEIVEEALEIAPSESIRRGIEEASRAARDEE